MKAFLTCLLAVVISSNVHAQYQKMAKANSLNVSGSRAYVNLGWTKQLSNRNSVTLSGSYFQDDAKFINTDNFSANLSFNRWLFRIGDAYLGAGTGLFFVHTKAKSAADEKAENNAFGSDLRAEVEYYPMWWFVIYAEVRQLIFFNSDFFDSKFIAGGGIKIVF